MSVAATDSRICLALLVLVMLSGVASGVCSAEMSGTWGSAFYRVELTVTGATVSGTFTSLLAPDGTPGTISGTLQQGGETFHAEWTQAVGAGHGSFNTLLALGSEGGVLVGYRWHEDAYPTSFSLHRAVNGEIPRLVDVDEAGGSTLAVDPATPAPPMATAPAPTPTPAPLAAPAPPTETVTQAPSDMLALGDRVGETFHFRITGSTTGSVWGSENVYTDDSCIATAAVHHGIVRSGEQAVASVTVLPGRDSYRGSTQNGVTTHNWGAWHGSFEFVGRAETPGFAAPPTPAPAPLFAPLAPPAPLTPAEFILGPNTEITICREVVDGQPVDATNYFEDATQVTLLHNYQDQAAGLATVVWARNGEELVRSERQVAAGNGWVSFSLKGGGGEALQWGFYEVTLTMPGRTPLDEVFAIGQAPTNGQPTTIGQPTTAPTTTPAVVSVPNLSGEWRMNANNSRAALTLEHVGNRLTGRVFNVPLEEAAVLADGTVTFIRTGVNQTYTGTFSLEPDGTWKLSGTFDCPVTRTTGSLWVATRDPRGGEAPTPTLPGR